LRFATYRRQDGRDDRVGVLEGERLFAFPSGTTLVDLLGGGREHLLEAGRAALAEPSESVALDDVELRAPIPKPPSIRDFLAFEEHLRNARGDVPSDWYELPIFYFSNPAAVRGPYDDIEVAPGSAEWDYELELAAVVGAPGSNLSPIEAERHIAGYMVMCDFSARDLQRREMKLRLGPAKGKDSATSLGPMLVTPDELEPFRSGSGFRLQMRASVDGRTYGGGTAANLYWSFGEMVAYASRGTTVVPGDVIGSGTVGTGCILELSNLRGGSEYPWLRPGNELELEIEQLGRLRHRIVAGPDCVPLRPALR
jgi:2-keto-4-pentenoate hydratase/2-oxohepta-3-ene-1,7-dioic acid hydratase in catechol pathway